ncbi:glycosyltransferase family 1 protein [Pontibacter saemangeumensis]|uniref:Glycosyltransferase family 1 protein n=1 Tax=Pontibacter saemangeumensis TaxID=1084525 RepID=A0ABP8LH10_9BACT
MKRIGILLNSEPYSGGMFQYNQSVIDALDHLPKNEFKTYIIYTKKEWGNYLSDFDFETRYIHTDVISELLSKVGKYLFLNTWRNVSSRIHPLYKCIRKLNLDIWIFPSQDEYSYQVKCNSICAIHDLMHRYEKFPEINGKGEFRNREALFSNIAKFSNIILVDSLCGKEQVLECYANTEEAKIHVLPYIAPPYIFEQSAHDFDTKFELPSKYLYYPAQFWEHKNHLNLFLALSEVKKKHADIKLVLVGSKKNGYDKAFSVIKDLELVNNIIYLGYVEDKYIPTLYKRARALVMPTFFGPTNIPPLEAMALGCPMAVSGIYGMKEQSKDAALYFDPNSVTEISHSLMRLWEDDLLCQELSEKGYAIYQNWNQVQFNEKFKAIVEQALTYSPA